MPSLLQTPAYPSFYFSKANYHLSMVEHHKSNDGKRVAKILQCSVSAWVCKALFDRRRETSNRNDYFSFVGLVLS